MTVMTKTRKPSSGGNPVPDRPVVAVDVAAKARRLADFAAHEQVWEMRDPASGLHAIIAIHDTTLGPALGGLRMWPYVSDRDAMRDALRLSRGMTFKAALAGLDLGGGKSVIVGDPRRDKSEALFRAFGAMVEGLDGRYIAAEDAGTSVRDMDWVAKETSHVYGTTRNSGDPSFMTALGVGEAIEAAVRYRLGSDTLAGVTVAVQGLGHVGYALSERLAAAGARLVVADVNRQAVDRAVADFGAVAAAPDRIHRAAADVFAPCALGAVLDDDTIPELECAIVAGSANNQLAEERHGELLSRRGILYAPDYVINAGGLISIAAQVAGGDSKSQKAWADVCRIAATLSEIFTRAEADALSPAVVADRIAIELVARRRRTA